MRTPLIPSRPVARSAAGLSLAGAILLSVLLSLSLAVAGGSAAASPYARSGSHDAPLQGVTGETGFLSVLSTPVANASVDGVSRGPTPIVKLELPVGPHQITLVSLDGKVKRTLGFKIARGENTRLKVNLE